MFTTKKYTRPVLSSELKKVNASSFKSVSALASAVSPQAGTSSAKLAALAKFAGGKRKFSALFTGRATATKKNVLSALK